MDSENDTQQASKNAAPLSAEERAALVGEWRKNRPDLSWQPLEGRELDRFLPLKNWLMGRIVYGTIAVAVISILYLWWPRETKEVKAVVIVAGKAHEDGTTAIVGIPGELERQVTYHGKEQLKRGQEIVLEEVIMVSRYGKRKSYRFKDPPEADLPLLKQLRQHLSLEE